MLSEEIIKNISEYPAGSEWRRWDLHIHTPETNKEDAYSGETSDEKWEKFYQSISDYVGDGSDPSKAIAVVGITDYVTIDNYRKVCADNRLPECVKLIIPNIEMRMTPVSSHSPVNIHFLFDPEIVDQLDTRFFNQLKIDIGGRPYHPIRSDLIALGKTKLRNQTDEDALFKAGVELFVINKDAIDAVMKDDPDLRKHIIIGVSNSSTDGLSGVGRDEIYKTGSGSQMEAVVDAIFKMVDVIFSGNPSDMEYFLGKKSGNNCTKQDVINRCGSLMPCVIGSDAHKNEKLFEPDLKRYCWIKADPTFNGLRQILYEPETRVKIQELQPEKKEQYYVIEGVKFGEISIDNSININGTELKGLFPEKFVPFNDHLNCIIGGKSTGKSLLLHNIAYAIDPSQVSRKCGDLKRDTKDSVIEGVKVRWKDGTISTSEDDQHDHKIVYIPQTYLNRLSESKDESTDIDSIIESIVLGNDDNREAYSKMKSDLDSLKKETDANIYKLLALQTEVIALVEQQKEIGTRDGIQREITDKENRRKEISSALSISEEEIKKYSDAEHEAISLEAAIKRLGREKDVIEDIDTVVKQLDFSSLDLSDEIQQLMESSCVAAIQAADKSWQDSKASLIVEIMRRISEHQDKLQADKTIINSLAEQVKQSAELMELSGSIKKQKEKLDDFNELDQKIQDKRGQIALILDQLSQTYDSYKAIHGEFAGFINEKNCQEDGQIDDEENLSFIVRTPFRRESFDEAVRTKFNKTVLKGFRDIIDFDEFDERKFTPDKIKALVLGVVEGTLKLLNSTNEEDTLRAILSDWYNTTYNVEMGGDTIGSMSPGKKALVLLKMLIKLEDSKCPILIDQPEDDLDNRSIYRELTPFILSRKVDRQIIVVTHNANVVLGSDAEEVIVANQDGKNTPNAEYKFEYVTGSIEHCNQTDGYVGVLYQDSIQQHICDILEGGRDAFKQRERKYRINVE